MTISILWDPPLDLAQDLASIFVGSTITIRLPNSIKVVEANTTLHYTTVIMSMKSETENSVSSCEVSPNENDVVSGRGSGANKHKGNLHFRNMIKDNKTYYLSLSKNLKMGVARQIYDDITSLDPPGRFLQKNPETDTWFEIKSDRALEKISQALREKPHAKKLDHPHMHNSEAMSMQPLISDKSDGLRRGSNNFNYPSHQGSSSQQYVDMHQGPVPGSRPVQGQHSSMQMQMMGGPGPMQTSQGMSPMHNAIPLPMPPPVSAPISVRVVQSQPSSFGQEPQYYDMRGTSTSGNSMYSQQQMPQQFQNQGPASVAMQARSSFQQQQQQHNNHNQYPPNQQMQQQQGPAPYPSMNTVITKVVYTDTQGRVLQEGPPRSQMMPATVQTVYTEIPSIPEVPREYLGDGRVSYVNAAAAPQQCGPAYSHSPMRQQQGHFNGRQHQQHQHKHQLSYQQQQQQHHGQSYSSQGQMHQPSYMSSGMQQQYPRYAREEIVDLSRASPTYGDDSRYIVRKTSSVGSQSHSQSSSYENAKKRGRSEYSSEQTPRDTAKRHQFSSSRRNSDPPGDDTLPKTKVPLTLKTNNFNKGENTPVPLVSPLHDDKKNLLSDAEEEEAAAAKKDSAGLNTLSTAASMLSKQ